MAHTEVGFEVVKHFIDRIAPWGIPDSPAKMVGRGIAVIISPLPRNKRAPNPKRKREEEGSDVEREEEGSDVNQDIGDDNADLEPAPTEASKSENSKP